MPGRLFGERGETLPLLRENIPAISSDQSTDIHKSNQRGVMLSGKSSCLPRTPSTAPSPLRQQPPKANPGNVVHDCELQAGDGYHLPRCCCLGLGAKTLLSPAAFTEPAPSSSCTLGITHRGAQHYPETGQYQSL